MPVLDPVSARKSPIASICRTTTPAERSSSMLRSFACATTNSASLRSMAARSDRGCTRRCVPRPPEIRLPCARARREDRRCTPAQSASVLDVGDVSCRLALNSRRESSRAPTRARLRGAAPRPPRARWCRRTPDSGDNAARRPKSPSTSAVVRGRAGIGLVARRAAAPAHGCRAPGRQRRRGQVLRRVLGVAQSPQRKVARVRSHVRAGQRRRRQTQPLRNAGELRSGAASSPIVVDDDARTARRVTQRAEQVREPQPAAAPRVEVVARRQRIDHRQRMAHRDHVRIGDAQLGEQLFARTGAGAARGDP